MIISKTTKMAILTTVMSMSIYGTAFAAPGGNSGEVTNTRNRVVSVEYVSTTDENGLKGWCII